VNRKVVILALALLASACGARLSASQTKLALDASGSAGSGSAASGSVGSTGSGSAASGSVGSTGSGSASSGSVGSAGASAAVLGPAVGGGQVSAPAPAAGNGGATDVGVTASTITIANIASLSGVAPGLFQTAQQATEAFAAYVNSQGGIYGRVLKVIPYDDQNDSGQNQADSQDACGKAFALVGSESAFDDGGASVVAKCGIPNVAGFAATAQMAATSETYSPSGLTEHYYPLGPANWMKAQHPTSITKAAMIYLSPPVTVLSAEREMQAYSSVGFNWIYTASTQVTEPNYTPYVLQMRSKGVQLVMMSSDYESTARLEQAMQQQNWEPTVRYWSGTTYDPGFINLTQPESNGDYLYLTSAMFQDQPPIPEMQLYLSWMGKVNPGYKKDAFGLDAWAADELFLQVVKAVGPDLTRKALLSQLSQIHSFGANGLLAPADVGNRLPSPCFDIAQIQNGQFVRAAPSQQGFICSDGGLWKLQGSLGQ